MVIDSLTFLGPSLFGSGATVDELLDALDGAGIDRAVVCPARPPGYFLGPANELVADAVRDHPDRLAGFARVDPNRGEAAPEEAMSALRELHLHGIFLHPWEETFRIDARTVDAVMAVARDRRVPVMIAAGYPWLSEGLQVGALARRFPEVTVIATNGGQINISGLGQTDVELAMQDRPNLHLQTAGVYREDFLEGIVERFGPERLLFSSAFPHLDPRLEVERPRSMHVSARAQEAVLGGTIQGILGIDGSGS